MVLKNLLLNSFFILFSLSLSPLSLPSLKFRNYFLKHGNISSANRLFQFLLLSFFFHSHKNPLFFLHYLLFLHLPVHLLSTSNPIFHFFLKLSSPKNSSSPFHYSKLFLILYRSSRRSLLKLK
jgi:hypothetical protein